MTMEIKNVLVTGSNGFIARNLIQRLKELNGYNIIEFSRHNTLDELLRAIEGTHIIYHLAGVNRPEQIEDFEKDNVVLTQAIIDCIKKLDRNIPIVFSSSRQASSDNPYGRSKKRAEEILIDFAKSTGNELYIFRLPNIFGKWSRPNYNSVVATFCYNISHNLNIEISDESKEINLAYIDEVNEAFIDILKGSVNNSNYYCDLKRSYKVTLGELARKIYTIKDINETAIVPDLSDDLTRFIYATFLSYAQKEDLKYETEMKTDNRGWLVELIKSKEMGQIFISKSYKGVVRGNHYHHTKVEKFCVICGKALIKLRNINTDEVLEYFVSGDKIEIIDIAPGYTHSIENLSEGEMLLLIWANEIFNSDRPDTYYEEV